MVMSKRKYYSHYSLGLIVASVLALVGTLVTNHLFFNSEIIKEICIYSIAIILGLYLVAVLFRLLMNGGIRNYYKNVRLIKAIEENLLAIGAYEKADNKAYAELPKIRISNDKIRIRLSNLKIRKKIEEYLASFSTALPQQYVVEDYYISQDNDELIIKYENLKAYKPEVYTLAEYSDRVTSMGKLDLYFDRKHIVNLNTYPHWLISGQSGSGKSYLVNQLLIQAIYKGFEVTVLDLKRSYGLYGKHIDYVYEIDGILDKLRAVETEMHNRLEKLQPELDKNPNVLAVDVGFTPKIIVLEEYISLQASLEKKEKEELERIVKSISVLARQSNIHLFIVLQSAGTENISPTTRSNLTKVLMGQAQSNILTATFGNGVDIPDRHMNRGEGLIQLDRITTLRVPEIKDIDNFE